MRPRTYFSTYFTYNFTKKLQSVSQWDAGWQDTTTILQGHTAISGASRNICFIP